MNRLHILVFFAALSVGIAASAAQPSRARAATPPRDLVKPAMDAERQARQGKAPEAAKRMETVWKDMKRQDPMLLGGSTPIVVEIITAAARKHPDMREKFRALRDESAHKFEHMGRQYPELASWIVLNGVIDESDRTLSWWDRVRTQPHVAKDVLLRLRPWLEPLLESNGRLGDLAVTIDDPAPLVRREYDSFRAAIRRDTSELNFRVARDVFLNRHGKHYASLLLAGRERDAKRLATEAMTVDHSAEMVVCMVTAAMDHGKLSKQHLDWLSAIGKSDELVESLKKRVQEELARSQEPANPDAAPRPVPRHGPNASPITTAARPLEPEDDAVPQP